MSDDLQKLPEISQCPGGPHGTTIDWLLHAQFRSDFDENWFNSTG
jgi:hypothetical protein